MGEREGTLSKSFPPKIMDIFSRNRERQQRFISEVQSNCQELRTDIEDEWVRLREKAEALAIYGPVYVIDLLNL